MPRRPARRWMGRCVDEVAATGSAESPGAVCASTWNRKSEREKRAIVNAEEGRSVKKKKKGKKKHPHHKKTTHHAHRTKKKHHGGKKKKKGAHRCPSCGHTARHDRKAGCLHHSGLSFCNCKHRG